MRNLLLVLAAALVALPASAQIGVGLRVGTLGPGVEVAYSVNPKLSVRGVGSYLALTQSDELDEEVTVEVEGDVTIGAIGALVDFHPFENFFRLTGGLTVNLFDVAASGVPIESYCLGNGDTANCDGKVFSPERMGNFAASVQYASTVAPYLGIGIGKVAGESRVGFLFDIGTLYTGSPEIDLEADGLLAPTASAEQEGELNTGIESFKWFPVVSLGLAIRL